MFKVDCSIQVIPSLHWCMLISVDQCLCMKGRGHAIIMMSNLMQLHQRSCGLPMCAISARRLSFKTDMINVYEQIHAASSIFCSTFIFWIWQWFKAICWALRLGGCMIFLPIIWPTDENPNCFWTNEHWCNVQQMCCANCDRSTTDSELIHVTDF